MSLKEIRETKNSDIDILLTMLSMHSKYSESQNRSKSKEKPNRVYYD